MALQSLNLFDLSQITTSNSAGFSDNGGYHFVLGVDTVTLAPSATSHVISIDDTANTTFDDDPAGTQSLSGAQAVNGIVWPAGTVIEAEYILQVSDPSGRSYTLQFVSLNGDAYNVQGFVVQGAVPPFGVPLVITAQQDMVSDTYPYAGSAPNCFDAATAIDTPAGARPAGLMRRGMEVLCADGSVAKVALVLRATVHPAGAARLLPVEIAAGCFGHGRPEQALRLSRQHRIAVPGVPGLIPVGVLIGWPGVRLCTEVEQVDYVHLVLVRHALLRAEGLGCESFWPGPLALAALPAGLAARVRGLMGEAPQRALPFLGRAAALRALRHNLAKPVGPQKGKGGPAAARMAQSASASSGISTSP